MAWCCGVVVLWWCDAMVLCRWVAGCCGVVVSWSGERGVAWGCVSGWSACRFDDNVACCGGAWGLSS